MASKTEIANRALQRLGAKRITSLNDDSRNARAVNAAFEPCKLAELRKHTWSCASKRVQLAASSTPPAFGYQNSFPLPSDFIRLLSADPGYLLNGEDFQIEGRNLLTDESDPRDTRYVYDVTDPNEMDVLLREVISCRIALEICEEITQSNTKKQSIQQDYDDLIAEARRANAIEKPASKPPEDTWVTVRE